MWAAAVSASFRESAKLFKCIVFDVMRDYIIRTGADPEGGGGGGGFGDLSPFNFLEVKIIKKCKENRKNGLALKFS